LREGEIEFCGYIRRRIVMKVFYKLYIVSLLTIIVSGCEGDHSDNAVAETGKNSQTEKNVDDKNWKPDEKFAGTVNGDSIVFGQRSYTEYRLWQNGKVTKGVLNTERGFEKDGDATVYVPEPENEDAGFYLVRMTSGEVIMLDKERRRISSAKITRAH
jgi:hypothetical protein